MSLSIIKAKPDDPAPTRKTKIPSATAVAAAVRSEKRSPSFRFDDNNDDNDDDEDDGNKTNPPRLVPTTDTMLKVQVPSVPWIVSWSHGCRAKAPLWQLHSWVALALTLDGRDKLTKVLQYSARLLAWWFAGTHRGNHRAHAQRFAQLKTSLTNSRKAFRLGRSLIEYQRLTTMGLWETILWHLLKQNDNDDDDYSGKPTREQRQRQRQQSHPPAIDRRASSNIGWGPVTVQEEEQDREKQRPRYHRSLSQRVYRTLFRPLLSRLSSRLVEEDEITPLWKLFGNAIKMLGLCGFWAADNVSFLALSGVWDDYSSLDPAERLARRQQTIESASIVANRSYFISAVAGWLINVRVYLSFRRHLCQLRHQMQQLVAARQQHNDRNSNNNDDDDDGHEDFRRLQQQYDQACQTQFHHFVALVKSCCDVLVFSNNPGIDLWQKYAGRKLHEGLHCLCGLLSASTVLHNNFPNAAPPTRTMTTGK